MYKIITTISNVTMINNLDLLRQTNVRNVKYTDIKMSVIRFNDDFKNI